MTLHWKTWIEHRFSHRREQQLWRERAVLDSPQGARIVVRGRELVNFCSNDYLGLANHAALRQAAVEAIEKWGCGSGASHLIGGHSELHERLEHELAVFVGAEKAVLFSTGYMANLSIPHVFLERHDRLVTDKLNHASLIDAAELAKCKYGVSRYPHCDWEQAQKCLRHIPADRKMLMTDGVFSMEGDLAPLVKLSQCCKEQQAMLVVDDAHGFGVMGATGMGTLEHFQIPIGDHVMMMGTLGKAAGSFGAFVAGDRYLMEALIQFGRSYIYTTALPSSVAAMALAALQIFRQEPERRARLHENVAHFRQLAVRSGIKLAESQTPIQPIFPTVSAETQAKHPAFRTEHIIRLSQRLLHAGFWVTPIRPPTIPIGTDRLRITISAEHRADEIGELIEAIVRCESELNECPQ